MALGLDLRFLIFFCLRGALLTTEQYSTRPLTRRNSTEEILGCLGMAEHVYGAAAPDPYAPKSGIGAIVRVHEDPADLLDGGYVWRRGCCETKNTLGTH